MDRRTLLFFLASLTVYAHANPASSTCEHGKVSVAQDCRQISGLQDFLNQEGHDWQLSDSQEDRALLRKCLREVRTTNMALIADSKAGCPIPDDQAFKLLTKLGQEEIREYDAQQPNQKDVLNLIYVDPKCFGSICYQTRPTQIYNPTEGADTAR